MAFSGKQFQVAFEEMVREVAARPQQLIALWKQRFRDMPQTNFELGKEFARRGQLKDAAFRFKLSLKLASQQPEAWYQLGMVNVRLGKKSEAKSALLEALKLRRPFPEVAYLLATIDVNALPPAERPTRMPEGMVENYFAQQAPHYNALEAQKHYQAPTLLVEQLRPHLTSMSGLTLVDLGCGTGLLAKHWGKVASRIIGLELIPAMAAQARALKGVNDTALYHEVIEADIRQASHHIDHGSADVVLCGNVLPYMGDVSLMLRDTVLILKSGGLLALTCEPFSGGDFGVVGSTGRFGHSLGYLERQTSAIGLRLLSQANLALYPQQPSLVCVFQKA